MPDESKAEEIVRDHFRAFKDEIVLEKKPSASPKIKKLLASASKRGTGQPGFPDFIGRFREHSDLLLVVECKSDLAKHESDNSDKWEDYAVDGVLFYADHLAKEFDVLAIAFSGTTPKHCKVSHFLQLRNGKPETIFGDALLDVESYLKGYYDDPVKVDQDYGSLLAFVKVLNSRLHSNKVPSKKRALLIASILIALERPSFQKSYTSENNSSALAESITSNVSLRLNEAGIDVASVGKLAGHFGVAESENALLGKENELRDIVRSVDTEINTFKKNHKFVDVLGELYIEFLRHANSDKGLGIVLTPPHITELFAEMALIDKNSKVYDNCAGTGGFLISAMKKMIDDAKGDTRVIERIKTRQLFGVELQSDIYPLLLANMYIHRDGRTNMIEGDCFDLSISERIAKENPTVGLLNPPYRSDKRNDKHELEFVKENLDCLQEGGICIALLPMQCALGTHGATKELKRDIMSKHTLEAVLSLPNELFFNSKVGVVSCAMIFKAGKGHTENTEVFLGYFKDDGFVKTKNSGRSDLYNNWQSKQEKWIDSYRNKREQPGISTKAKLTYDLEWAAEAYMETDYSIVGDDMFKKTLLGYSTYLFANELVKEVSSDALRKTRKQLPPAAQWKYFPLKELFEIKGTKTTSPLDLSPTEKHNSDFPYVTTKATDNGVEAFYGKWTEEAPVLTVDSAVLGYCAYQKQNFIASDHVEKLVPKFEMDDYLAMFLVTIINMEQYRYNYGRKCSQSRLKETRIKLPASRNKANWNLMRDYIRSLPYSNNLDNTTNHIHPEG